MEVLTVRREAWRDSSLRQFLQLTSTQMKERGLLIEVLERGLSSFSQITLSTLLPLGAKAFCSIEKS